MKDANPNKKVFARRLLGKLYDMGLIPTADTLERVDGVSASSFCRRRLPSMMMTVGLMSNVSQFLGFFLLQLDFILDPSVRSIGRRGARSSWTDHGYRSCVFGHSRAFRFNHMGSGLQDSPARQTIQQRVGWLWRLSHKLLCYTFVVNLLLLRCFCWINAIEVSSCETN